MYRQEQTKSILIYLAAALFFGTLTNCYKVDDLAQSLQHAFIPKQKSNVFKDQSLVNEIPWTFNTCGSYDNFFIYFFSLTNQPTTNMEINYMVVIFVLSRKLSLRRPPTSPTLGRQCFGISFR